MKKPIPIYFKVDKLYTDNINDLKNPICFDNISKQKIKWSLNFNEIHLTLFKIYSYHITCTILRVILDCSSFYLVYQYPLPILSKNMTALLKQIFLHDFSNPTLEIRLRSCYLSILQYFEEVVNYINNKIEKEKLNKFDYKKEIEKLNNNDNISITP